MAERTDIGTGQDGRSLPDPVVRLRRAHASLSVAAASLALIVSTLHPAHAQDAETTRQLLETRSQLDELVAERTMTEAAADALANEIQRLRDDRSGITNALIQSAKTERKLANDILALQGSLEDLETRALGIRRSLIERRAVLSEVLAALQRMGLNPPPAMLVSPDNALSAVRSAILMGAVVPELRARTSILIADLEELDGVRRNITLETTSLTQKAQQQQAEQARLELLLAEKRRLEDERLARLADAQQQADALAAQAGSLEELVASLENQIRLADEAAQAAREAERRARADAIQQAEQARERGEQLLREGVERAEAQEADRPVFAPTRPFSEQVRALALPVAGRKISAFGDDDGFGGRASGETVASTAGAIVTAPTDATVLYAGPFRAYGQLIILDVGDEYHIVLAGMERLDVVPGQTVLSGEPVGRMGEVKLASVSAQAAEIDEARLYVEFRKAGRPVDPSPWWETDTQGRT